MMMKVKHCACLVLAIASILLVFSTWAVAHNLDLDLSVSGVDVIKAFQPTQLGKQSQQQKEKDDAITVLTEDKLTTVAGELERVKARLSFAEKKRSDLHEHMFNLTRVLVMKKKKKDKVKGLLTVAKTSWSDAKLAFAESKKALQGAVKVLRVKEKKNLNLSAELSKMEPFADLNTSDYVGNATMAIRETQMKRLEKEYGKLQFTGRHARQYARTARMAEASARAAASVAHSKLLTARKALRKASEHRKAHIKKRAKLFAAERAKMNEIEFLAIKHAKVDARSKNCNLHAVKLKRRYEAHLLAVKGGAAKMRLVADSIFEHPAKVALAIHAYQKALKVYKSLKGAKPKKPAALKKARALKVDKLSALFRVKESLLHLKEDQQNTKRELEYAQHIAAASKQNYKDAAKACGLVQQRVHKLFEKLSVLRQTVGILSVKLGVVRNAILEDEKKEAKAASVVGQAYKQSREAEVALFVKAQAAKSANMVVNVDGQDESEMKALIAKLSKKVKKARKVKVEDDMATIKAKTAFETMRGDYDESFVSLHRTRDEVSKLRRKKVDQNAVVFQSGKTVKRLQTLLLRSKKSSARTTSRIAAVKRRQQKLKKRIHRLRSRLSALEAKATEIKKAVIAAHMKNGDKRVEALAKVVRQLKEAKAKRKAEVIKLREQRQLAKRKHEALIAKKKKDAEEVKKVEDQYRKHKTTKAEPKAGKSNAAKRKQANADMKALEKRQKEEEGKAKKEAAAQIKKEQQRQNALVKKLGAKKSF